MYTPSSVATITGREPSLRKLELRSVEARPLLTSPPVSTATRPECSDGGEPGSVFRQLQWHYSSLFRDTHHRLNMNMSTLTVISSIKAAFSF